MMNGRFAAQTGVETLKGGIPSLDTKATLIYNKHINIRAFADRSGLLAMALFLTVDIFYERIIGVKI